MRATFTSVNEPSSAHTKKQLLNNYKSKQNFFFNEKLEGNSGVSLPWDGN